MSEVIIIGGGAAGMMAAIAAAQNGHHVTLYEKNEKLGKKVFITGKGRCNVTNAGDTVDFFGQVVHNPKSLYSAVYSFDATFVMDFMEQYGCALKVERGNRVFPVSDHSSDVIRACRNALQKLGVQVCLNTKVSQLCIESSDPEKGGGCCSDEKKGLTETVEKRVTGVRLLNGTVHSADAAIVATGGLSYPVTGSDGDGHRWADDLDLTVETCRPALVPLCSPDPVCQQLQGLSLKNVTAALFVDGKEIYREMGEMLFTHFGVSGPLVLSASSYYADQVGKLAKQNKKPQQTMLVIDLKPALTTEQLDKRILRDFEAARNKQFKNAVDGLFPAKLTPVMVARSGIPADKAVHDITRKEREDFCYQIKHFEISISGTRDFNEAIITQGGISMKELNPSTMECKHVKGLYFAGEVLDVDALTGGYNLQIAWSTGHLAGSSIEQNESK